MDREEMANMLTSLMIYVENNLKEVNEFMEDEGCPKISQEEVTQVYNTIDEVLVHGG